MNVTVVIATYGDDDWSDAAWSHAYPSLPEGQDVVVIHEADATLAEVRNAGAALATGDWLCFLDADDQLDPSYLTTMRHAMKEKHLGPRTRLNARLRPWDLMPEASNPPTTVYEIPDVLLVPAVKYVAVVGPAEIPSWGRPLIDVNCAVIGTLVPRLLFQRVGGFREFPIYEDWDLWLRCVIAGARLIPVPDAIYLATPRTGGRNSGARGAEVYWEIRREHEAAYHLGAR